MEYRQLGGSGFKVPALSLGTATFGGGNEVLNRGHLLTGSARFTVGS
jgi:aryl-alcohol dehydrogenase-like predicted oxidoreductase